jgi:hypothetical protein
VGEKRKQLKKGKIWKQYPKECKREENNDEKERKNHVRSCEGRNEVYNHESGRENKLNEKNKEMQKTNKKDKHKIKP